MLLLSVNTDLMSLMHTLQALLLYDVMVLSLSHLPLSLSSPPLSLFSSFQPKPIDVNVITHHMQRYAVWFGGSMLASTVSLLLISLCLQTHCMND